MASLISDTKEARASLVEVKEPIEKESFRNAIIENRQRLAAIAVTVEAMVNNFDAYHSVTNRIA